MTKTPEQIIASKFDAFVMNPMVRATEYAREIIKALEAAHCQVVYREPIAPEDVRAGDHVRIEERNGTANEYMWTFADGDAHEDLTVFLTAPRKPQIPDEPGVRFDARKPSGVTYRMVTLSDGKSIFGYAAKPAHEQSIAHGEGSFEYAAALTREQFIADGWEVVES